MEIAFVPDSSDNSNIRTADLPAVTLYRANFAAKSAAIRWDLPTLEVVAGWFPEFAEIRLIARGGMGAVYRARQLDPDRIVAIKLLPLECCENEHYRKRFQREAEAMERVRHPRIVSLFGVGTTENELPYLVMEYVEGTNLHEAIHSGTLTLERAKSILSDVCEGLAYAHENGVVHRDIKPSNVLIDQDGRAKIADFGTARWHPLGDVGNATTGALFGTRDYLAPELIEGGTQIDHRADIYALGVMLYEAFCRDLPRGNFTIPSQKIDVDSRLDSIVARAMRTDPEERYSTVAALLNDLRKIRVTAKVATPREPRTAGPWWRQRIHWVFAAAAVLAGALVLLETRHAPNHAPLTHHPPSAAPRTTTVTPAAVVMPQAPPVKMTAPADARAGWHDWFAEQVSLPPQLIKDDQGYILTEDYTAGVALPVSPILKDQAVRVTYHAAASNPRPLMRLRLRASEKMDVFYGVYNQASEWQLICKLPGQKIMALANADKSPTDPPDVQVAELRVVGDRLTFLLNGREKFSRQGRGITEGRAAFYCTAGITIHSVKWADLTNAP